jgi:hypothetical protein
MARAQFMPASLRVRLLICCRRRLWTWTDFGHRQGKFGGVRIALVATIICCFHFINACCFDRWP